MSKVHAAGLVAAASTTILTQVAAGKVIVAAKVRRVMLRALCRRTRSLRRSLRQFTREIYICP